MEVSDSMSGIPFLQDLRPKWRNLEASFQLLVDNMAGLIVASEIFSKSNCFLSSIIIEFLLGLDGAGGRKGTSF